MNTPHLLGLSAPRNPRVAVPFRGLILGRATAGVNIFANGVTTDMPFDVELLRTDQGIGWDGAATITIPAGCRFARVGLGFINSANTSGVSSMQVLKTAVTGWIATTIIGIAQFTPIVTQPFPVVAGDTIKAQVNQTSGAASNYNPSATSLALCGLSVELIP